MKVQRLSLLVLSTAVLATSVWAVPLLPLLPAGGIDIFYEGYSWERDASGGYPPAQGPGVPGNVLGGVGQVLSISDATAAVTLYDPADEGAELTFLLSGLVSQGAVEVAPSIWRTDYVGGQFGIYFDDTPDFSAATGPDTYTGATDGVLWVSADVQSFSTLYYGAAGIGTFSGTFAVTGGLAGQDFATSLLTWGGSNEAAVPDGWTYTHRIKGVAQGEIVPEPSTLMLLGTALLGAVGLSRKVRG